VAQDRRKPGSVAEAEAYQTPQGSGIMPAMTESTAARAPTPTAKRDARGRWLPGISGHPGGDAARARKSLNQDTILEMHAAFREGGRAAINKVMTTQPAVFLKLLVLLVPRELEVTRSQGVKAMSDEAIEEAVAMISEMLAKREAGVIDVTSEKAEPLGDIGDTPKSRKAQGKTKRDVGQIVGCDDETPNS
jgi:hypothetical protein